jgi:N-terminal acetyltransferase 2
MIPRLIGLNTRRLASRTFTRSILKPKSRSFNTRLALRDATKPTAPIKPPTPTQKLSLKELSRKYGWAAVGVYLALSAIDLPICFLFVHSMGQEKAQEIQNRILEYLGRTKSGVSEDDHQEEGQQTSNDKSQWGVLLTEFGIAYAIHKTVFIFVRVPATAAITPWAVKTLQRWGYNIGKSSSTVAGGAALGTTPTKKQRFGSWFF